MRNGNIYEFDFYLLIKINCFLLPSLIGYLYLECEFKTFYLLIYYKLGYENSSMNVDLCECELYSIYFSLFII